MNHFTQDELRRAVIALNIIKERGDRYEWEHILREAEQDAAPSGSPWHYATANQRIGGSILADKLASLLGADPKQCEMAAAEVFTKQRHRAVFDALISYAAELTGKSASQTSSAAPIQPAVRIVAGEVKT